MATAGVARRTCLRFLVCYLLLRFHWPYLITRKEQMYPGSLLTCTNDHSRKRFWPQKLVSIFDSKRSCPDEMEKQDIKDNILLNFNTVQHIWDYFPPQICHLWLPPLSLVLKPAVLVNTNYSPKNKFSVTERH